MNSDTQAPCRTDIGLHRRAIRHLRCGSASPVAARLITTGTEGIESELFRHIEHWSNGRSSRNMVLVAADWGFGKTHVRMLLTDSFLNHQIPFIHDQVDGKAGSLAHLHRAVPRWMESLQRGSYVGLRTVIETGFANSSRIRNWCLHNQTEFSRHILAAMNGRDWSWALAAGHQYQFPDYSQYHFRSFDLLRSAADLFRSCESKGICLLLDEAENISRQHDIRGRRKSYDTLNRLLSDRNLFSVVFVTDRFFDQVAVDRERGMRERWLPWSDHARRFLSSCSELPLTSPPAVTPALAKRLVEKVQSTYASAFRMPVPRGLTETILETWKRTSTRSVRLLVRLTIEALDCINVA